MTTAARKLPNGKAPGPDGIPNEVIRAAVMEYPQRFAAIYNWCIKDATFPSRWKKANLVPLRKPGKPLDCPSAYRPIFMLDAISKLFEKIIVNRLREYVTPTDNQYDFRVGKSTIDALAKVREAVNHANGHGQARNLFVGLLTLDVKNAFNSAPWAAIMEALRREGIPQYLQDIVESYFSGRTITVSRADGSKSIRRVSCGDPQGSVLSPDLWNVLYNGLLKMKLPPDVEIIAFVDDIALVATALVLYLLEERFEEALGAVVSWMSDNGLELALDKTEAIVLTNRNVHNSMTVRFGTHSFESKRSVKYLGVQIDQRLHFGDHAKLAAKRAADACRQLSQLMPNAGSTSKGEEAPFKRHIITAILRGALLVSNHNGQGVG